MSRPNSTRFPTAILSRHSDEALQAGTCFQSESGEAVLSPEIIADNLSKAGFSLGWVSASRSLACTAALLQGSAVNAP